jgi:hypothetical protein
MKGKGKKKNEIESEAIIVLLFKVPTVFIDRVSQ